MKIRKFVIALGLPLMLSTTLFAQEAPVADKPEQDPAKRQEVNDAGVKNGTVVDPATGNQDQRALEKAGSPKSRPTGKLKNKKWKPCKISVKRDELRQKSAKRHIMLR
jgi:hypothetical protein